MMTKITQETGAAALSCVMKSNGGPAKGHDLFFFPMLGFAPWIDGLGWRGEPSVSLFIFSFFTIRLDE